MKSFQALRSPAIPLTLFHDLPVFLISSSIVLRHSLFGLPLVLYSCGFQSNAVFSIAPASLRNVCPIQFHSLLFIWISIGFYLVIFHISLFVILSVHFIFILAFIYKCLQSSCYLTLVDLQLDAQNSYLFIYNTFIKILYMFRALPCSSLGVLRRNCIYAASGIVTLFRWLFCVYICSLYYCHSLQVTVLCVYMQPLVLSLSAGDCLVCIYICSL
jgi:hypothetical protein